MKNLNLRTSLLALLFVFGCAALASAEPGERGDRGDRGDRPAARGDSERGEKGDKAERGDREGNRENGVIKMLFKDVDVTAEQREAVKGILKSRQDERQAIRAEMREAHEAKDREALQAAAGKMWAFMQETHTLIAAELTDGQKAQFNKNVEELKAKMQERRERRTGEGRGEKGERPRRGSDDNDAE